MNGYLLEWRVNAGAKAKNVLTKLLLMTLVVLFFLLIYFPHGINGYLAENWKVTLFLKNGVEPEKGSMFAERLGRIDFVSSARYFSEEEVWDEFLSNVGNPENLKKVIGSPIPGYIEVKFKKKDLNEKSLKRLILITEKENLAKDILYGGTSFHRMIRIKKYMNASITAAFIFFLLIMAVFLYYLDADLLLSTSKELSFIKEHGSGAIFSKRSRLAGSVWEGFMTGCLAFSIAVVIYHMIFLKFPSLQTYLTFPSTSDYRFYLFPLAVIVIATALIFCLISHQSMRKIFKMIAGEQ